MNFARKSILVLVLVTALFSVVLANPLQSGDGDAIAQEESALIASNGQILNSADIFVVYTAKALNRIYSDVAHFMATMPAFRKSFNVTLSPSERPNIWNYYETSFFFGYPLFKVNAVDRTMEVTMKLTSESSYTIQKAIEDEDGNIHVYKPSTQSVANKTFVLTAPLRKLRGDMFGNFVALNFTSSDVTLPDIPIGGGFPIYFRHYWKNSSLSEVFNLGAVNNTDTPFKSLSAFDFDVCGLDDDKILLAINNQYTGKPVSLPARCEDFFPKDFEYLPKGRDAAVYFSPNNTIQLVKEVLANDKVFSNVSADSQTGKFTDMVAKNLASTKYSSASDCHVKVDHYGTYCPVYASKPIKEHIFEYSLISDNSKDGTSKYEFQYKSTRGVSDAYVCSENFVHTPPGETDYYQARCGCFGKEFFTGNASIKVEFAPVDDTVRFNTSVLVGAVADATQCQGTLKPKIATEYNSDIFGKAKEELEKGRQMASQSVDIFRVSSLLFPNQHVLAFTDSVRKAGSFQTSGHLKKHTA